ncbi:nitrate- and nitrite sensing domain-containing protein [Streptomyces sp. NPDC047002]|uniref:sensor histidine kinase n=1 Tax=Streptomyces sp. NPDC047002 TaxID=3155475 RepID=UPI003453B86D
MGRRKRVRTRLVAGVVVTGIVVAAAGTPGLLYASARLDDAQRLVTLARLDRQAVSLSDALADERDQVVVFVAAGRPAEDGDSAKDDGEDGFRAAGDRVDRQITELDALVADSSVPAAFAGPLKDLGTVTAVRRAAVAGKGSAVDAYTAYSRVVDSLLRLDAQVADLAPAGAAPGARADADLDRAADEASATRGLLLAALAVPVGQSTVNPMTGLPMADSGSAEGKARDALSAAAQLARVRERAALDAFDATAGAADRRAWADTVTGAGVKAAEGYLDRLTAAPELSDTDLDTDRGKLDSALTARIDQMRGARSGLAADRLKGFEKLRDDAVRDLELRAALAAGCLVVAVVVSAAVARTLTRPLAAVRRGAARLAAAPATEGPARLTGRNDEFAEVVRALNTLHARVLTLTDRIGERAAADAAGPVGGPQAAEAAEEHAALQARIAELSDRLRQLRHTVRHTFVNLSLRNLGLVERQLGVIESLEEREQDPERLATLYKLDHMATVMRRHSENLLVLAEHEQSHAHAGPVPLVDVLRAAVSEIEPFERVTIQTLPPHAQVAGHAADDLSHLVAELLENAASFSSPDAAVELSGWLLESGEVMLSVVDQGIGLTDERLTELNTRLAVPAGAPPAPSGPHARTEGLGLRVTALLAARHGVRVELRRQQQGGGITAVVNLPQSLLPSAPPAVGEDAPVPDSASALSLPGSVAEANSPVLPVRPGSGPAGDPVIAAAEASVRAAERAGTLGAPAHSGPRARDQARTALEQSAPQGLPVRQDPALRAAPVPQAAPGTPAAQGGRARVPAARQPRAAAPGPDPYAIGPDAHERPAGGPDQDTFTMRLPGPQGGAPGGQLPKRVPRAVRTAGAAPVRKRGVDPEELRRRLGGFHQGAKAGRHDAEAEIRQAEEPQRPGAAAERHGQQGPAWQFEGQQAAAAGRAVQQLPGQQPVQRPAGQRLPGQVPEQQAGPYGGPAGHQQPPAHRNDHQQDHTAQRHTEAAGDTVEEAHS